MEFTQFFDRKIHSKILNGIYIQLNEMNVMQIHKVKTQRNALCVWMWN